MLFSQTEGKKEEKNKVIQCPFLCLFPNFLLGGFESFFHFEIFLEGVRFEWFLGRLTGWGRVGSGQSVWIFFYLKGNKCLKKVINSLRLKAKKKKEIRRFNAHICVLFPNFLSRGVRKLFRFEFFLGGGGADWLGFEGWISLKCHTPVRGGRVQNRQKKRQICGQLCMKLETCTKGIYNCLCGISSCLQKNI